jgi:uncharacterized YigZ family protein
VAYRTLANPCEHLELIKGSRFRTRVIPLTAPEAAAGWVAQLRAAEPDAHHVAWAWRYGAAMRFSDDGEPGGTAGRPMLEVLLKRDLDRVVALVARVFGGVRLGAGGLVRAYSGGVAKALDLATIAEVADLVEFTVRAPFSETDTLLRLLHDDALQLDPPHFDSDGVVLHGSVLAAEATAWETRVTEASRGRARWQGTLRIP